jgi:hypothetical protein
VTESWTAEEWQAELLARKKRGTKTVVHDCGCGAGDPVRVDDDMVPDVGVFRCARCLRLVCWCVGGTEPDERADYCADCYVEVTCPVCKDGVLRDGRGRPSASGRCGECDDG